MSEVEPAQAPVTHEIASIYPLTPLQQGLLFHSLQDPHGSVYVVQTELLIDGDLDVPAFQRSFQALADRHDALRTAVMWEELEQPLQVVYQRVEVPFVYFDWYGVSAQEQERRLDDLFASNEAQGFKLTARAPLFRLTLIRLAENRFSLVWCAHHIILDGWSRSLLCEELLIIYQASARGDAPQLKSVRPFRSYVDWLGAQDSAAAEAYWRRKLAGFSAATPLGADREPPVGGLTHGEHVLELPSRLSEDLRALARGQRLTLNTLVQGAWALLLSRYSGERDVLFGVTVAGRPATLDGAMSMVGIFINTLPFRAQAAPDQTLIAWLKGLQAEAAKMRQHEHSSLAQVQLWSDVPRGQPLFESILVFESYPAAQDTAGGLRLIQGRHREQTSYPLTVIAEPAERLTIKLSYQRPRFDASTIERMAEHMTALLEGFVANPGRRLYELSILSKWERDRLLLEWNPSPAVTPEATLASLFEAQAAKSPNACAVVFEGVEVAYSELNARADQLAQRLQREGVRPESLVTICSERSIELVVGLLGILKSGAAYVPLDPDYPAERLRFMLADTDALVLLTQKRLLAKLPEHAATTLLLDDPTLFAPRPSDRPSMSARADNIAYAIYTSGSTGKPKSVLNHHRGVCNRLDWMQKTYCLGPDDVVLQKTPVGFDVSVWELFWPLLNGARLVLARPGGHKDAAYLRDLIIEHEVTTVHFVPSMLAVFLAEAGVSSCRTLRRTICSGEELPPGIARQFFELLPGELHNLYGPTEAAIDVSAWRCRPELLSGSPTVPIGASIQNILLYVLDPEMSPVPIGMQGELHIGGVGLARGYHRRPALTAERFCPDPFAADGSRLYKTGDRARFRPDGTIELLGRLDQQVKLRGQRIELGEIEAGLLEQGGVRQAVVTVREDSPGDKRLIAYVVPDSGAPLAPSDLRAKLKESLPEHMIPSAFVLLEALPLSPNGKLDRKALPAPEARRELERPRVEPRTANERALASIWIAVLGVQEIGIDDDFFELGGHSLLAVQVIGRAREVVTSRAGALSVMDLFKRRTIRELAALCHLDASERDGAALLHELTPALHAPGRKRSFVAIPAGGGHAVSYQPLADSLPCGVTLYSVALPAHDPSAPHEERQSIERVAERLVAEVLERVEGPLVIYGHCINSALAVEVALRLEAAGRDLEGVFIGGSFPTARLPGKISKFVARKLIDRMRGDRALYTWLRSLGGGTGSLDEKELQFLIGGLRHDGREGEEYFTRALAVRPERRLAAPIVSVVGELDPLTDFYEERFSEWGVFSDKTGLAVIPGAGHFFNKHQAKELAEILVSQPERWLGGGAAAAHPSRSRRRAPPSAEIKPVGVAGRPGTPPAASLNAFLAVWLGQLVSLSGSAITSFALGLWAYKETRQLTTFTLISALGLLPGVLLAPVAGVIVDRSDRRRVMLVSDLVGGVAVSSLLLLGLVGAPALWQILLTVAVLSAASAFQRPAYNSAVFQLVPKQYLGYANGFVQLSTGVAQLIAPLLAVLLLTSFGLTGVLLIDTASYLAAVASIFAVRFPTTMPYLSRESFAREIVEGFRYFMGRRGFRYLLGYFAVSNLLDSVILVSIPAMALSFTTDATLGRMMIVAGLGAIAGGLVMGLWGGPNRYIKGILAASLLADISMLLVGLRPSVALMTAGLFSWSFALPIIMGCYVSIVHVKVPYHLHGRAFAITQMTVQSMVPAGFLLTPLLAERFFKPLLLADGALAPALGSIVGVGPERGLGLMAVAAGALLMLTTILARFTRPVWHIEEELPDVHQAS